MPDDGVEFLQRYLKAIGVEAECVCHRCIEENCIGASGMPGFLLNSLIMILCPECGSKRCPKASDHRFSCTGSNEPGQDGSIYA